MDKLPQYYVANKEDEHCGLRQGETYNIHKVVGHPSVVTLKGLAVLTDDCKSISFIRE